MAQPRPNLQFESLLDYLKVSRGFDFTAYKRSSLVRRVDKRMQEIRLSKYEEYGDYLEVHPEEFTLLFNTILINVTSFFRNPDAWRVVAEAVIPRILESKSGHEPIRIWSAGCASGQEAYSIAMQLAEAIGIEEFQRRVKIYATDADEEALQQARQATYSARELETVPPPMVKKYFEQRDARFSFLKDLRRMVIYGRHDLISDAPISRIDMVTCRNTLMYLNAETQARVLSRFHFALNDGGFLMLGQAETLLSHLTTFTPVDLKRRVFMKVTRGGPRDRLFLLGDGAPEPAGATQTPGILIGAGADAVPIAQILVDTNGILVQANQPARQLLNINPRDIGRPLQDLEISYRPVELRSLIEQAQTQRHGVTLRDIPWNPPRSEGYLLEVHISSLIEAGSFVGVSITFLDTTRYHKMQEELDQSRHELETASEELQSTNEELETTNEELQSTVEELETTNEELQSTNEELETMNEELQSTNEELQTLNDELHQRGDEVANANGFLNSVLTSLQGGVIAVDPEFHILAWSQHSEELWGLRAAETRGKHLLSLDIGLPVEQLKGQIRLCLSGEQNAQTVLLEATNRRGKNISIKAAITPLYDGKTGIRGALILVEEN
ncbi:MAG: CheR family methyltransferase [Gemmatimonadota bacterium]